MKRVRILHQIHNLEKKKRLRLDQVKKIADSSFISSQRPVYESEDNDLLRWFIKLIYHHVSIIKVGSKPVMLWNFVVFTTIFYLFLQTFCAMFILELLQVEVGRQMIFNNGANQVVLTVFVLDMLFVRWRVETYGKSQLLNTFSDLIKNYLGHYFMIDLIAIILLVMDISGIILTYFRFFFYLKVFMLQKIKVQINLSTKGHIFLQLGFKTVRLLFFAMFWTFFFSSLFVSIELIYVFEGGFNYENGFLWLTASPTLGYINLYQVFDWKVWFQYALFFVMQMMRGCGLGVPTPRNPLSILLYNISNVTVIVVFYYFADKVVWLVNKYMYKDPVINKLSTLKELKKVIFIPFDNYIKYRQFLKVNLQDDIKSHQREVDLARMIPEHLRKHMNYGLRQHFALRFTFLKSIVSDTFSEEVFKRELAHIVTSSVVYQGQIIFQEYTVSSGRLYMSESSEFVVSNDAIGFAVCLPPWSFVGINEFFIDRRSRFQVFTSKIGVVQYIEKDQFVKILKLCPRIYLNYCEQMEAILIDRKGTETIEYRCWHCQAFHLSEDCDKVSILDLDTFLTSLVLKKEQSKDGLVIRTNPRRAFQRKGTQCLKNKTGRRQGRVQLDCYKGRDYSFVDYNLHQIAQIVEFMSSETSALTSVHYNDADSLSDMPLTP